MNTREGSGPLSEALRAKYRRWSRDGRSVDEWRDFLSELAKILPVVRVPASRLVPESPLADLDQDTFKARCRDVRAGEREWVPIVIEGLAPPLSGPLLVVDGNHRAHAVIAAGTGGEWLDAVIARHVLPTP